MTVGTTFTLADAQERWRVPPLVAAEILTWMLQSGFIDITVPGTFVATDYGLEWSALLDEIANDTLEVR